jgi:hypothetical protein
MLKKLIRFYYSVVVGGHKHAPSDWADKIANIFNAKFFFIISAVLLKLDLFLFGTRGNANTISKYIFLIYLLPLAYLIFYKIGVSPNFVFKSRPYMGAPRELGQ